MYENLTKETILETLNSYGIAADCVASFVQCDLSPYNMYEMNTVCALSDRICVLYDDGSIISQKYSKIEDIYT